MNSGKSKRITGLNIKDHLDRVCNGKQKLYGNDFSADRKKYVLKHLESRNLQDKEFAICDLLRIAFEFTDDSKFRKLILLITNRALAMHEKLKELKSQK